MKLYIWFVAGLILASEAQGEGLNILTPNYVAIDAYKNQRVRDPYLAPIDKTLTYGAVFSTDFDFITYNGLGLSMQNELHFDQSGQSGHIKHAGWQYSLDLTLIRTGQQRLELFKGHHSRHILEETREARFPVWDRAGIRFVIFDKNN